MRQTATNNRGNGTLRLDLLPTNPSKTPFHERVKRLNLSSNLEKKICSFAAKTTLTQDFNKSRQPLLTRDNEQELATEVLLYRHRFTEQVIVHRKFRQAALTIIQNIYLFQNRKIFFGSCGTKPEAERQEALNFLTCAKARRSIPLIKTFQHLIIARIWNRILAHHSWQEDNKKEFSDLLYVVDNLNTIRNIYMLLSYRLVQALASRINSIYKSSVSFEDAVQIGSLGVARAAYRYHQSSGVRFSTYAANWIFKEIQRQSLAGRLIRISASSLDRYSSAAKSNNSREFEAVSEIINRATVNFSEDAAFFESASESALPGPSKQFENRQMAEILVREVEQELSEKSADIIKRRYGLPPYKSGKQSIISISKTYGVTRSCIYQIEHAALKKLRKRLSTIEHGAGLV